MKNITLLSFVLLFSLKIMAGDDQSFFALKGSYSMPLGDYALYDLDKGCFTTEGISFGVEGAWYFYKNLGIGADVNYSLHSVDAIGIANKKIEDAILLNQLYVRSDPYKMITTMAGFYYAYQVMESLRIEPKILAGLMFGSSPFQLYEQELYLLGDSYYKITSSQAHAFAIKAGISIKYKVSPCIALSLLADYTQSDLSFGFYSSDELFYRNRKIAYLDFGLGLVIVF